MKPRDFFIVNFIENQEQLFITTATPLTENTPHSLPKMFPLVDTFEVNLTIYKQISRKASKYPII